MSAESLPYAPRLRVVREDGAGYDATSGERAGGARHSRLPYAVMESPDLSMGAVVTYGWLQRHTGAGGCFPSYETLAGVMRCSERSAKAYVAELEAAGFVSHRRGGGGRNNTYALHPDGDGSKGAKSAHNKGAKSAHIEERVQNLHPKSAAGCTHLCAKNDTHNKDEPEPYNQNHLTNSSSAPAAATEQKSTGGTGQERQPSKPIRVGQKHSAPPRIGYQASLDVPLAVAGALESLGVNPSPSAVAAMTVVLAAYPGVDHGLAAPLCADWCAENRVRPSARTYRSWCEREAKRAVAEEAQAGDGRSDPDRGHRGIQGVLGDAASEIREKHERKQRADREFWERRKRELAATAHGAGHVP